MCDVLLPLGVNPIAVKYVYKYQHQLVEIKPEVNAYFWSFSQFHIIVHYTRVRGVVCDCEILNAVCTNSQI
jgi:hypothetical protein